MDCSIAAALGLPDEQSQVAEAFLIAMPASEIWVPSLWWHEIGNVIASAKRRKRITDNDTTGLVQLYGELPLHTDTAHGDQFVERVLRLTTSFDLSAYDAAYLELAERKRAGLATLDKRLREAAADSGVEVFLESRR